VKAVNDSFREHYDFRECWIHLKSLPATRRAKVVARTMTKKKDVSRSKRGVARKVSGKIEKGERIGCFEGTSPRAAQYRGNDISKREVKRNTGRKNTSVIYD